MDLSIAKSSQYQAPPQARRRGPPAARRRRGPPAVSPIMRVYRMVRMLLPLRRQAGNLTSKVDKLNQKIDTLKDQCSPPPPPPLPVPQQVCLGKNRFADANYTPEGEEVPWPCKCMETQ